MSFAAHHLHLATLLGLLVLGGTAAGQADQNPPADQNFRLPGQLPGQAVQPANPPAFVVPQTPGTTNPYMTPVRPGLSTPLANLSTPYLGGSSPASLVNTGATQPYNPYNPPYNNPYTPIYDPYGGALTGVANVINATAQYQVTIQQARLGQQHANQAMLDTRRRLFDQIRYERMSMPTPEEIRVRDMEVALGRSRRNPPLVEIWSGEALNSLFNHIVKQQGLGLRGPRIDLDEDLLKRINVNSGTGGNIGLLKDGTNLQWPLSLQAPAFSDARKTLSQLLPEAIQQIKFNNPLSVGVQKDIQTALQFLNDTLNKNINDLTPTEYIDARRYLNQLNAAFKALQDPNAPNYFNQKWTARGKTVAELVKNMADAGLQFAPATPGDEAAYRALHTALVSYDENITGLVRP